MQILYKELAEYHKKPLATMFFSSSENNLFKNLKSLNLCQLPLNLSKYLFRLTRENTGSYSRSFTLLTQAIWTVCFWYLLHVVFIEAYRMPRFLNPFTARVFNGVL